MVALDEGLQAIWTCEQAKAIDQLSIEKFKIPAKQLMEAAGDCVANVAAARLKKSDRCLVLVGSGNNGGDGVVAARRLHRKGYQVQIYLLASENRTDSLVEQLELAEEEGVLSSPLIEIFSLKKESYLIIDGLLGIGLSRPLKDGVIKDALSFCNTLEPKEVIAIDLPSGMNGNLWKQESPPLPATITVTFGGLKPAQILGPSSYDCGSVRLFEIGFEPEAIHQTLSQSEETLFKAGRKFLKDWEPIDRRSPHVHKYQKGHLLVIGGSPGKNGAPLLSSLAAQRSGAGWITMSVPDQGGQVPPFITQELLFDRNQLDLDRLETFLRERKVKGLVVGPGTMESPFSKEGWLKLAQWQRELGLALVIDAGALHNFCSQGAVFNPQLTLVTPHPGEYLKGNFDDKKPTSPQDLIELSDHLEKLGVSLIYKSSTPIVLSPGQSPICYPYPDPKLAQAGSGDILAGIAASLLLSGCQGREAGILAQHHLCQAAKRAGKVHGNHPNPLEIIDQIRI